MPREQVEARLGPADVDDTITDDLKGRRVQPHAVYVFPRDLSQRLARDPQPSLRLHALELTYLDGRLVRIGNAPPVRSTAAPCDGPPAESARSEPSDPSFSPYRRFLGVAVGDRLGEVRRKLGPWSSISRGGDFVNMSPTPVTFDVGEDPPTPRKPVNGFAVGSDDSTVYEGGWVDVAVDRDPKTCLVHGFRFVPPRGGG